MEIEEKQFDILFASNFYQSPQFLIDDGKREM